MFTALPTRPVCSRSLEVILVFTGVKLRNDWSTESKLSNEGTDIVMHIFLRLAHVRIKFGLDLEYNGSRNNG